MMKIYRLQRVLKSVFTTPWNKLKLLLNNSDIGKNFKTCGNIHIINLGGYIKIGENVYINSHPIADPIGGQSRTILRVSDRAKIVIGNNVGISNAALCADESIVIEDYVCLGAGCKIYDTDFHSSNAEFRLKGNTHVVTKPVFIKEKAFIGGHTIILKGVTVGREAVVGAGSVVVKDIPDREIWAGNPAKFIGRI